MHTSYEWSKSNLPSLPGKPGRGGGKVGNSSACLLTQLLATDAAATAAVVVVAPAAAVAAIVVAVVPLNAAHLVFIFRLETVVCSDWNLARLIGSVCLAITQNLRDLLA